jgi:putative peptide maturation dehydrogenase
MKFIKRNKNLHFSFINNSKLNLSNILSGGNGLLGNCEIIGHISNSQKKHKLEIQDIEILNKIDDMEWTSFDSLKLNFPKDTIEKLLQFGFLAEKINHSKMNDKECLSVKPKVFWHELSQLLHYQTKWDNVKLPHSDIYSISLNLEKNLKDYFPPPTYKSKKRNILKSISCSDFKSTSFDKLLDRRKSSRNFNARYSLEFDEVSLLLKRVFGVKKKKKLENGLEIIFKNSPSGGAIHPTNCYFLAINCNNLNPGLYFYESEQNTLELLKKYSLSEARKRLKLYSANQEYFENCSGAVILTTQFDRLYWKYKYHSKAYKVALIEMGNLTQNFYLSCAEMNLNCITTAAINDVQIDNDLGIDTEIEGVGCVIGFGKENN